MTPLAEKLFNQPDSRANTTLTRELLAGCQYFDVAALEPIYNIRNPMTPTDLIFDEFMEAELPACSTWLQRSHGLAVIVSNKGARFRDDTKLILSVVREIKTHGLIDVSHAAVHGSREFSYLEDWRADKPVLVEETTRAFRWAWFAIEAMQTPGGLTHRVAKGSSRQLARAARRSGRPEHKWVEIRLGRPRPKSGGSTGGAAHGVAWHYRRGHRVNHPNPNYPKWRKGCWCGSPDLGIRSHEYLVVPGPDMIVEARP